MRILGISAFYHDASACLIVDGVVIAAAQEERFTREKNDQDFPVNCIEYCLKEGRVLAEQVDYIVFYDKPFLKFDRLFETYLAFAPNGFRNFIRSLPLWLKEKLFQKNIIIKELASHFGANVDWSGKILFSEHHLSHAASAFFPSPFKDSAVLTMDGVGEWVTTSLAIGSGNSLKIIKEIKFPHSIGLLYSAFTYYLGFKVNSGEYKVMGLAPYGVPKYTELIKSHLIDIKADGSFRLDMSYFGYCTDLVMTNEKFNKIFGAPPRKPEGPINQREMDLAASIQQVLEEVVLKLSRSIRKSTGQKNLCLAGGVALNCVANGKIVKEKIFDNVWIQPASGDAGASVGAALAVYYLLFNQPRFVNSSDGMNGSYLGPSFEQEEIELRLNNIGAKFESLSEDDLLSKVVAGLVEGEAVGWHQGRMEFGPRALGARSIIADPRSSTVQKMLNMKVKYRESFRPFAPSILEEDLDQWFDLGQPSPYMLLVADVLPEKRTSVPSTEKNLFGLEKLNILRSKIPAVTHVDYSSRVQSVSKKTNEKYWNLIARFKSVTDCPVLVNTSFNVRGEPIVCSPEDAFRCFMATDIELLVIGNCFLRKVEQNAMLGVNYLNNYELD